jgi:hypothetical protein
MFNGYSGQGNIRKMVSSLRQMDKIARNARQRSCASVAP